MAEPALSGLQSFPCSIIYIYIYIYNFFTIKAYYYTGSAAVVQAPQAEEDEADEEDDEADHEDGKC